MPCQWVVPENLVDCVGWVVQVTRPRAGCRTYRFVTLWVSAFRIDVLSLVTSAIVGASGAAFCVSSIEKSMLECKALSAAALRGLENDGCRMRDKGWSGQQIDWIRIESGSCSMSLSDCHVRGNAA